MDGQSLLRELRQLLSEGSDSTWLEIKSCYDYLWEAACMTAERTSSFSTTQSITTTASPASYNLNPDFLKLAFTDNEGKYFIKYNNGTSDTFLYHKAYDSILLANTTTAVSVPSEFTIMDASALAQLSSTATSTGSLTNSYTIFGQTLGKTTLTDTAGAFITNAVAAGDLIHNTTDNSHGVVLSVTSATALVCALFDGSKNYFTSADAYIINRQGRFKLIFNPINSTASHTVTVYYIQRPTPVYDPYGMYNFAPGYKGALVYYAAWRYKYRDREPNFGDAWYKYWDYQVRILGASLNNAMRREGYRVNLIKKADRTGSRR
jgi:hypothetical protein